MSVIVVSAVRLAIVAAYAHGHDDPIGALVRLSAANARTFVAQYGDAEPAVTANDIADEDTSAANLDDAAGALCSLAYNCHTNAGADCRTDEDRAEWEALARAILCEQTIQNVTGPRLGDLRAHNVPGAPDAPCAPRPLSTVDATPARPAHVGRDEAIERIRVALRRRTGKVWSVTCGRGTAAGWITVHAPPRRRAAFGYMTEEDAAELARAFAEPRTVHHQGLSISPDSRGHYVATIEA